jgi:hypothetical protein
MKTVILLLLSFISLFSSEWIEYKCIDFPHSSCLNFITGSQKIHLIEIDPELYEIKPVKALENGIGRESVLSINNRYGAVASSMAVFFQLAGFLKEEPAEL